MICILIIAVAFYWFENYWIEFNLFICLYLFVFEICCCWIWYSIFNCCIYLICKIEFDIWYSGTGPSRLSRLVWILSMVQTELAHLIWRNGEFGWIRICWFGWICWLVNWYLLNLIWLIGWDRGLGQDWVRYQVVICLAAKLGVRSQGRQGQGPGVRVVVRYCRINLLIFAVFDICITVLAKFAVIWIICCIFNGMV